MVEQDQARRLRELVREASRCHALEPRASVVVTIAGGCSQVGASTVATQLAAELACQSVHAELLSAENWIDERSPDADLVLIDAGAGFNLQTASMWRDADLVLLVATTDRDAVLETYSTLKLAHAELPLPPVYLVPNRCADSDAAQNLCQRISDSTERFLGIGTPMAAWLPTTDANPPHSHDGITMLAQFLVDHFVGGVSDAETAQISRLATSAKRYRGQRPLPLILG